MRQLVFGGLPFVMHVAWIARPGMPCGPVAPGSPFGPGAPAGPAGPVDPDGGSIPVPVRSTVAFPPGSLRRSPTA